MDENRDPNKDGESDRGLDTERYCLAGTFILHLIGMSAFLPSHNYVTEILLTVR